MLQASLLLTVCSKVKGFMVKVTPVSSSPMTQQLNDQLCQQCGLKHCSCFVISMSCKLFGVGCGTLSIRLVWIDRKPLMQSFRAVLYCADKTEAAELYDVLLQSAKLYENFQQHVETLWERRSEWCLAWRNLPHQQLRRDNRATV